MIPQSPASAIRIPRSNPLSADAPGHSARMIGRGLAASGDNESAPETGALPNFVEASGSDLGRLGLQKLA
jgi:hypothetical protein